MSGVFDGDIENAAAIAQDISYQIQERDAARRLGSDGPADLSYKIRNNLATLAKSIEGLEAALREFESGRAALNPRVLAQRKEAVRKLQIERGKLVERERSSPSSDRDALLSGGVGRSYGRETELTRDMTTHDMVQRSEAEMKNQDAVLADMSKSLDTLKTMGHMIGDETKLQMKLLDDTEGEIDKGSLALKRETARVEHVTKEAKTCWMYSAICLLLIILLALVLVKWH